VSVGSRPSGWRRVLPAALAAVLGALAPACDAMRTGAHPDQPPFVQRPNGVLNVVY
jgi:hypothetical protein